MGELLVVAVMLLPLCFAAGCDGSSGGLAEYEGERPLILQRVTQAQTPDVQWVGGRVAAVGVNRGDRAALDSTLVWVMRADGNTISSHVTIGEGGDDDFVRTVGGEPIHTLSDGETYTVWLADATALADGLDTTRVNEFTFVDTTITMRLVLRGRSGGDPQINFNATIALDERLTGTRYVMTWTPEDVGFRQIAIRQARTGGFTDLVWHVVVPDDQPPSISSPVVLGQAPEGTQQAVAFEGFEPDTYTLFMVTDDWDQTFGVRSRGYVFFQILSTNFEDAGGSEGEGEGE
ncbi:MAG TPA: hypothetical protein VF190_07825 [Rhodothermales bacterium]